VNIPVTGTNADAANIARAAAYAHERDGLSHISINGEAFDLIAGGWCSRFARKVCAAVTGIEWPPWAGRFAVWTERNLHQQDFAVDEPEPGDLVCFNALTYHKFGRHAVWGWPVWKVKVNGAVGHIGVFLGDGLFAENTSSSRGPGTVISDLSRMASRISGYYRPLRSAREASLPETVKVVRLGTNMVTEAHLSDGHYRVTVRDCADLTDCELVTKHLREQRKLYLWPRAWGPVPHSDM